MSKIHDIDFMIESLKNISQLRNNESEMWRLYDVIKDLPFFLGWDRLDAIIAFSDSVIRVVGEDGRVQQMVKG